MPRPHHFHFAKVLIPQMVSSNPDRMFQELTGPKREAFLMFLWQEAGKEAKGPVIPHVDTVPLAPGMPAAMTKLDSLGSSRAGNHEIVFLTMPAALEPNEALYIALVREGRTPRVFFYERCMGNNPAETHATEAVCSAVDEMGGRVNYGFHVGLTFDDFRRVLGQVLGVDVPAPTAGPGMEAVLGGEPGGFAQGTPQPAASSGFKSGGAKSWGSSAASPAPALPGPGPQSGPAFTVPLYPDPNALFPLLKAKDWPHKALAVTMPLPGIDHPDAPCVAFARNADNQYVLLTKQEAGHADPKSIFLQALVNLASVPTDMVAIQPGIALCGGNDFAADRLVDPNFMSRMHQQLGSQELFVCAPHRQAIYGMSTSAPEATKQMFNTLIQTELTRQPPPGAPVSDLVFRVVSGKLQSAHKLGQLGGAAPKHKAFSAAMATLVALAMMLVSYVTGFMPMLGIFISLALAAAAGLLYRPGANLAIVSASCFAVGLVAGARLPYELTLLVGAVGWGTLGWMLADCTPKPQMGRTIAIGVALMTLALYLPGLPIVWWFRVLLMAGLASYVAFTNKPVGPAAAPRSF